MKRRAFLKSIGLGGAAVYIPTGLTISSILKEAHAASPNYSAAIANYVRPNASFDAVTNAFPQIINIFLYGGPSELAGNLTNIDELENTSQVSYESQIPGITDPQTVANGRITASGFWGSRRDGTNTIIAPGAGGDAMQFLVDRGHMTVYRTMMQRRGSTQSHRDSIFMNQKGTMDLENSPGIGTRVAVMLDRALGTEAIFPHPDTPSTLRPLSELILPFVSFEGESTFYAPDPDNQLSRLQLRPVTMSDSFENPYSRNSDNAQLQSLADAVMQQTQQSTRFNRIFDSLELRKNMADYIGNLRTRFLAPLPSATVMDPADTNEDIVGGVLAYPNNTFARQVRAAVTLAIENPDTKYITISNGGLGGFDDHNNGVDNYPQRMENLFNALRVAMKHIKYSGRQTNDAVTSNPLTTPGGRSRRTDNIIINVFGDFGRRVNLNGSLGWDHGNCQVLYTLGGTAVRPNGATALGKVVGTTVRTGSPGTNDQYLEPAPGDANYSFEPMCLAASIYRYFGVQNTGPLTSDPVHHPNGHTPIDESRT